jgi:hypothetical protein
MGDCSISVPRVKPPCTHLVNEERSGERAVGVVRIKYDRLAMKFLQVFNPGKVDKYKDADLSTLVRKDRHDFTLETHGGNPTNEKAIAKKVTMVQST